MSIKEENEVTVRVTCSKEEVINRLKSKGFYEGRHFSLDDDYYIPNNIDINRLSTREILDNAILIRYIVDEGRIVQKITYKIKKFADNGDIIKQTAINCDVLNVEDAKKFFSALGYYKIMNIKEDDIVYNKDKFELAVKFIKNSDILIEIETEQNTDWDTVEKIKDIIFDLDIPIESNQYFIKKAENELNKILNRE